MAGNGRSGEHRVTRCPFASRRNFLWQTTNRTVVRPTGNASMSTILMSCATGRNLSMRPLRQIKEAVAKVGPTAEKVREHLRSQRPYRADAFSPCTPLGRKIQVVMSNFATCSRSSNTRLARSIASWPSSLVKGSLVS
jgi:hypothetical protein